VFIGFSAGPGVHIVDVLGLRDPLLAQLAENDVIDVRRIHDLRHTFASLLLQQGESIVYAKEQLGHASIQITVDTYGHPIPGANREAVDKLDDVPTQPNATPAQPEAVSADRRQRRKLCGMNGERAFTSWNG